MIYSCGHPPTVLLTDKKDFTNQFAMCDNDKTDPDFVDGFRMKKI